MPSSSRLNVSHVKVWGRLVNGSSAGKPNEVIVAPDGSLVLSAPSESGKSHHLDMLNWELNDLHSQAQKVMQGLNVCLLNLSIGENGNPGEFVKNYGAILQRLFTGKKDVQISFALFGINDISCIDLVDFSKVEDADASSCFRSAGSVKEVLAALPNEVTLPTFLLLNVQCRTPQGTTTNGTLILGDIGGTCMSTASPAALDRSLARINSILLEMDQPYTDSQLDMNDTWLSLLLKDYINGNGELVICADLVQNGSIKALISGLLFLENLRKIKNFPQLNFVDENIRRLADLEQMNDNLEQDKRQAQRDLKELRGNLETLEEERRKLHGELSLSKCSSETERFEKEYLAATMELQSLDLKDKLRKCEVELITLDELNLRLKMEKHYLLEERSKQEKTQRDLEAAQHALENDHKKQIDELGTKLADASLDLNTSRKEAEQLKHEIAQANAQIQSLSENLQAATKEHSHLLQKTANSPTKTLQEREIQSLKRQLDSTKQTEERLTDMLKRNEDRADDHRRLMMDLERQLGDQRAENARLAALNSVSKTPIIVQQPAAPTSGATEYRELRQQTQEIQTALMELTENFSQKRKQEQSTFYSEKKPRTYMKRPTVIDAVIPSPMMEDDYELPLQKQPETVGDILSKVLAPIDPKVKEVASKLNATRTDPLPKPVPKKAPIRTKHKEQVTEEPYTSLLTKAETKKVVVDEPIIKKEPVVTKKEPVVTKKEPAVTKKETEHTLKREAEVMVPPDSPSKYKPSTFKPTLPVKPPNNENNPNLLTHMLYSKDRDANKRIIKIPEKPQQLDLPVGGFRTKTNVGEVDPSALNNIISNMTVDMSQSNKTKK